MKRFCIGCTAFILMWCAITPFAAGGVYTLDADFDLGVLTNVNHDQVHDQLQLDAGITTTFRHIWVACSGRDTAVRIDTDTGQVLGEYYTRPAGRAGNPSRTTVDQNGDVWLGNRNEWSGGGSITKISASATGPSTSTGAWNAGTGALGTFDARPWTNAGGADNNGGTSTASDPAILQYVRTPGTNVRTIAIDKNNDVWAGGYGNKQHNLFDGDTGAMISGPEPPGNSFYPGSGKGGYGGLIDGNGVLWSAGLGGNSLVRYDPATDTYSYADLKGYQSYGLGIDTNGKIWNSNWTNNTVTRLNPDGSWDGRWSIHGSGGRGVAVTPADNDVWIANSNSNTVCRLNNDGSFVTTIPVGVMPTGVAVDANGKVWVTNYNSNNVMRIDPATNLVDLTVSLNANARPYNYSDMTGTVVIGTTNPQGTWRVVEDGGPLLVSWDNMYWNTEPEGFIPPGGNIVVEARAADLVPDLASLAWTSYLSGDALGLTGRYIEMRATLYIGDNDISPVLSDLTVTGTLIPEPSTLIIWSLLGALGITAAWWRRRRKAA